MIYILYSYYGNPKLFLASTINNLFYSPNIKVKPKLGQQNPIPGFCPLTKVYQDMGEEYIGNRFP